MVGGELPTPQGDGSLPSHEVQMDRKAGDTGLS
jgi:hypothetical protein